MPIGPRGFTLIELLVAVTVLAVATLGALRVFDAAQRGIGGQAARVFAQEVAQNHAARLRLLGASAALPPHESMGGIDWEIAVRQRQTAGGLIEARIAVSAAGHPGATLTVFAPRAVQEAGR